MSRNADTRHFPAAVSVAADRPGRGTILRKSQHGMSIMVALFILVVLALLGVALVTIGGVEHRQPLLSLQGKRAFWAARSGLQWGGHEALHDAGFNCPKQPATPASEKLPSSVPGLDGFSVTVSCSYTTHEEHGKTVRIYDIEATARNGVFGQRADLGQRQYRTIVSSGG